LTLAFQKVPGQIAKSVDEARAISEHVTTSVEASKEAAADIQKLVEQAHATLKQLKDEIQRQGEITIETTRQALDDVRQKVSANMSSENVVKAYEEATRKRFGEVIDGTVQPAITKSTTLITNSLQSWAEGVLDQHLTKMSGAVNATLTSVTRDFRVRLYGAWSGLLWAMVGGGVIAGLILFMAGFYLGKH
jgi:membrane-associated HD superfamily phosphohydrolase